MPQTVGQATTLRDAINFNSDQPVNKHVLLISG